MQITKEKLNDLFAVGSSLQVAKIAIHHTIYTETRETAQEELLYSLEDMTEHLEKIVYDIISQIQDTK